MPPQGKDKLTGLSTTPTRKPPKPRKRRKRTNLSDKKRKFVLYYMGEAQGVATHAARLAGYAHPEKTGSKLLADPLVQNELDRARRAENKKSIMSRNERMERLAEIATENASDRTKAIDILNKMDQTYVKRIEVDQRIGFSLDTMTTADLEALVIQLGFIKKGKA